MLHTPCICKPCWMTDQHSTRPHANTQRWNQLLPSRIVHLQHIHGLLAALPAVKGKGGCGMPAGTWSLPAAARYSRSFSTATPALGSPAVRGAAAYARSVSLAGDELQAQLLLQQARPSLQAHAHTCLPHTSATNSGCSTHLGPPKTIPGDCSVRKLAQQNLKSFNPPGIICRYSRAIFRRPLAASSCAYRSIRSAGGKDRWMGSLRSINRHLALLLSNAVDVLACRSPTVHGLA